MTEYAQVGIPEYWAVLVEEPLVRQYVLEAGQYQLKAELSKGDTLRSLTLADLEIEVDKVYESE